jgi:very-short-patch-repair endonuclease
MTQFFNRTSDKGKRRALRKSSPKAETVVWSHLRRNQILGYKFRRQYSVGTYVIDFYSPGLKLAVEIDGDSHFQQDSNDENRQDYIQTFGIRFLRFTNEEVFNNLEGVLEAIFQIAQEGTPKTPPSGESPPYEGGDIGEVV